MIARTILEARIAEVREALRRARLLRHLAVAFVLGILSRGSFLIAAIYGHHVPQRIDRWSMLGLIALGLIAWLKGRRNIWSDRDIARIIETKHPVLDSLLLTAIDHEPQATEPATFLHERLIDQALARAATQNWPITVANKPYTRALAAAWIAVIAFVATDVALRLNGPNHKSKVVNQKPASSAKATVFTHSLPATPKSNGAPASSSKPASPAPCLPMPRSSSARQTAKSVIACLCASPSMNRSSAA